MDFIKTQVEDYLNDLEELGIIEINKDGKLRCREALKKLRR